MQNNEVVKYFRCCGSSCLSSEIDWMIFAQHILHTYWCFLMSACSPLSSPFITTALSYVWWRVLFSCRLQSPRTYFTFEITWNASLMQQGNFIDVFLARHVSGVCMVYTQPTQRFSRPPPIHRVGTEKRLLQLNI